MVQQPKSFAELIAEIRSGLVCGRCGKYVGSLAERRYLPPPYAVALDKITAEDEVEALIGFERHMLARMRNGNFTISHPQVDGKCATFREWIEREDDDYEDEEGDET
ncbi:MAG: hypothetical protein HY874_01855 [Chloroflexi bacterium]|nr:hypothetical protein [Chloroflexota bacterium]